MAAIAAQISTESSDGRGTERRIRSFCCGLVACLPLSSHLHEELLNKTAGVRGAAGTVLAWVQTVHLEMAEGPFELRTAKSWCGRQRVKE